MKRWRTSKPMVSVARDLRQQATRAEDVLWELVRARRCGGWRFVRQAPIGPFVLDFYCPAVKLAVEADGGIHNEPDVARRDAERQEVLQTAYGITFVRLPSEEILSAPAVVCQRIAAACHALIASQSSSGGPHPPALASDGPHPAIGMATLSRFAGEGEEEEPAGAGEGEEEEPAGTGEEEEPAGADRGETEHSPTLARSDGRGWHEALRVPGEGRHKKGALP